MIFIDLENKLPTDADLPADIRWSQADWDAWLKESDRLVGELASSLLREQLKSVMS